MKNVSSGKTRGSHPHHRRKRGKKNSKIFMVNERLIRLSLLLVGIFSIGGFGLEVKDFYFVDFTGKFIKSRSINKVKDGLDVNVSNLNNGIYLLKILTDKELNKVKIIIER